MASLGEKRTPMAWQHRDMNYHQGGYQDRYGHAMELGVPMRPGPPSTSDRLSHRTDKSWRTQKESHVAYPPARPYSSGRPSSRTHSGTSSSTSSSSTDSETEQDEHHPNGHIPQHPPPSAYGYYPGYPPSMGYPPSLSQYPGTIKSAKSVPTVGTWDGEPCPVHGMGPLSLPGPISHPMMMPLPGAMTLPPKRATSIYDMRMMNHPPPLPPPPGPMFRTLPPKPLPGDRRSMAAPPTGIPSQFLPPMARPRPLVVSEDGTAEPLPVRSPQEKAIKNGLPLSSKSDTVDKGSGEKVVCPGGVCVGMIVMGVISAGLLLGVLLIFIL